MKKITLYSTLCFLLTAFSASAVEKTWAGKISDSMCGASHAKMEHGGKKLTERDCTQACIKEGSKYVFVTNGEVHEINNQDMAALAGHAGHTVKLTGAMDNDGKITVSKIEMPAGTETTSSK
jgi:hypothetical protein